MSENDQPYVKAEPPIAVRAKVRDGSVRDGQVLGWRGDRVYITWRSEMGNHLGWVDADDVERA